MSPWIEYTVSALLVIGGLFTLVGAIGLARLPDFFTRLHGPTKATTIGVGAIMLASVVWFTVADGKPAISEILITVFLFITAPISANILAKAAMHLQVRRMDNTRGQPWDQ